MDERTCPMCSEVKPHSEFYANKSRAHGVSTYCKLCTLDRRRVLYADKIRLQQKAWNDANAERRRRTRRAWECANRDKMRAKRQRQAAAKPEQYKAYGRASDSNRRAREMAAPGRATTQQIADRHAYYGGKCWMCGDTAVEIDHVKPLAKGGSHWPANLRPACRDCNASKRDHWPYTREMALERRAPSRQAA